MAKKAEELSALQVARLRSSGMHAVGGVAGLYLHVAPGGARTWILRIVIASRRRDMGLGGFPDVTLAAARDKARAAREDVDQGRDPILLRKQARSRLRAEQAAAKTFKQCANEYIEAKAPEWSNPKHEQQWSNTLETYVNPKIGSLLVADVGLPQVLDVLKPVWVTKTETAKRVRGRIEAILDWATVQHYRSGINPARWKGHLDKILPAPRKVRKVQHHAALPAAALPPFMGRLRSMEGLGPKALEFLILTAARSGEVRGARWSEIDFAKRVWIVPPERMKAKREHRVPLSDPAVAALKLLKRGKPGDLVFPSARGTPLSDMTLTAVTRRMKADTVPHGFRSTFRDWCAEHTTHANEVAEMALAHVVDNKVEAAYRRGDLFERRRALMTDWAHFCGGAS
jgi:integrase